MCKNNFYNWNLKLLFLIFFQIKIYPPLANLYLSSSLFFDVQKAPSLLIEIIGKALKLFNKLVFIPLHANNSNCYAALINIRSEDLHHFHIGIYA